MVTLVELDERADAPASSAMSTPPPVEKPLLEKPDASIASSSTNGGSSVLFKIASLLMTGFFIFSAYVQQNDPDSAEWIAINLASASIAFVVGFGLITGKELPVAMMTLCLVRLAVLVYTDWDTIPDAHTMAFMDSEFGRESSALVIMSIWMAILASSAGGKKAAKSSLLLSAPVLILSVAVIAAAIYAPIYMRTHDVVVPEHCQGVAYNIDG